MPVQSPTLPLRLPPLEAMRTLLSAMGDGSFRNSPTVTQGFDLIAKTPTLLAAMSEGPVAFAPSLATSSSAANFLYMLEGELPSPKRTRALEQYLILLADHGMNASTFALRVVLSTDSDLVSAATAALGALKGPAHGGAPARVADMLDAVGDPSKAADWVAGAFARKERLYGFGHRAYKVEDPRAIILKRIAREVADPARMRLAEAVEAAALEALQREKPGRTTPPHERRILRRGGARGRWPAARIVHAYLRRGPHRRLGGPRSRTGRGQPTHRPEVLCLGPPKGRPVARALYGRPLRE